MNARELVGRGVLDITGASVIASVVAPIIEPERQRVAGFRVTGSMPVLPWESIKAIGADALTVEGPDVLRDAQTEVERRATGVPIDPIGTRVLLDNGTEIGLVEDILFDPTTGAITEIVVAGTTRPGRQLLGIGEFAMVLAEPDVPQ